VVVIGCWLLVLVGRWCRSCWSLLLVGGGCCWLLVVGWRWFFLLVVGLYNYKKRSKKTAKVVVIMPV